MSYDYAADIAHYSQLMPELPGKILREVFVNVSAPEFKAVYLCTDNGVYVIRGEIGSEILGIHKVHQAPETQGGSTIQKFPPFDCFLGKQVTQVRMIGEAWNGHGFELSFSELQGKTILIQSIYAGEKPAEYHNCLRPGIGTYHWCCEQQVEAEERKLAQ